MKKISITFGLLVILLCIVGIRGCKKEKKSPGSNTAISDESNLIFHELNNTSWKTYYMQKDKGSIRLHRYNNISMTEDGYYDLRVRWKVSYSQTWEYGNWNYNQRPDFFGLTNLNVVEFQLTRNLKNKKIKLYQK